MIEKAQRHPSVPPIAATIGTPPMAAKLNPMLNHPMARARRPAGNRSPTAAMRLVGASEPRRPAAKRMAHSAAKLGASAAAKPRTPTLPSEKTIIGRRPSRSESRPENGEPSACGTAAAAARSPAWATEMPRSREMSRSSGPTMVTDVTMPVTQAVMSA